VEALIESYGYTGVNFGRSIPPAKKRRGGSLGNSQDHQQQQQQQQQEGGSGGDNGGEVKDVLCNVVSTDKQG